MEYIYACINAENYYCPLQFPIGASNYSLQPSSTVSVAFASLSSLMLLYL